MSVKVELTNKGNGKKVGVTDDGTLLVTPIPPSADITNRLSQTNRTRYLRDFVRNNGSENMAVDGSVTPVTFTLSASREYDIHITNFVIVIADGTVSTNSFGALPALTNGVDLFLNESGTITTLIDKAKTIGQVLLQTGVPVPFGSSSALNEVTAYEGNDDAVLIPFPIVNFIPGGIRIAQNSIDKIEVVVNDNLTGLAQFTVQLQGYRSYPSENAEAEQ